MRETSKEIESTNERAAVHRWAGRRVVTVGTAAGAVLVAALMLFSPVASAASAGSSVVLTAPYSGTSAGEAFWSSAGCGGTLTLSQLPYFNATTGTFTGSLSAAAKTCGKTTSSMFGEESGNFGTNSFSVASNGTYVVGATWTVAFEYELKYHAKISGYAGSSAVVGAWAVLNDLTNGSSWSIGQSSWSFGTTTHGSWVSESERANYTGTYGLVAGHLYEVITGIYLEVNTYANSTGHGTASGAVNMGAPPNDSVLTSIIVA
jgi:hypothetical protein